MSDNKKDETQEQDAIFEEPQSVKIAAPKAKGFNLKIIAAIAMSIVLVVFLILQFDVMGKKKKTPEELEKEKNLQTETATPTAMQGIEAVNKLPASYQNPNTQQAFPNQNQNQPGAVSNQELMAAQQKAAQNPYNNQQPYNNNQYNNNPQLPAPSQEQIAMIDEKKRKQQAEEARISQRENEERERIKMIEQERKQALASPLRFNMSNSNKNNNSTTTPTNGNQKPVQGQSPKIPDFKMPEMGMSGGDPNKQKEKQAYLDEERNKPTYLKSNLNYPLSQYQIMAGTIIPASFITGLNSDLPGQIIAQVRENVYDTVKGRYLLIPQSSRIVGEYSSGVTFGQDRILIIWTRLIFPDGTSINLEGMPGVDLSGYAGSSDKVNRHFIKIAAGAILSSVMGAAIKISAGNADSGASNFQQLAATGSAQTMGQAADKILSKMIDQQPTLEIRPGTKFNVFVNKDIILKPFKK